MFEELEPDYLDDWSIINSLRINLLLTDQSINRLIVSAVHFIKTKTQQHKSQKQYSI